ncbi:hypothetical protein HBI95_045980 [Parastagonospora nodorum]|nr:hypothetical protein HBI95_045980 [Parastagonospora nodorum]KAH6179542.1 hypothetical protein HBI68_042590 [Parastagonospora nodorum]KAH6373458.1 hypothetical protein HBI34_080380 [Parastagonospora nodorum]
MQPDWIGGDNTAQSMYFVQAFEECLACSLCRVQIVREGTRHFFRCATSCLSPFWLMGVPIIHSSGLNRLPHTKRHGEFEGRLERSLAL